MTSVSVTAFGDTVISCNDGDTCQVQQGKKLIKVRLAGIDAPEAGQEGAEAARKFLLGLIQEKDITLKCIDRSLGRENCSVFVGKTDIQSDMVRAGWAFDYPKYSNGKYKTDQSEAKKVGKGVWAFKNLSSPYCYRYIGTKKCNADKLYQP